MKTLYWSILIIIIAVIYGCERDEVIVNPQFTNKGVFVLMEGRFGQPSTYDYAFIDVNTDSIKNDLFRNSNNGASLAPFPDGMVILNNNELYIVSQGNFGSQGRLQKVNADDNKLLDTLTFGTNPYNITYYQENFYVTNINGTGVTKINKNFDVLAEYEVGPNPKDPVFAVFYLYVTKASYTTEYSLGVVNLLNNQTTKVFLPAPPVSVANQAGGIYVSSYSRKKLYVMDSLQTDLILDSIPINIPEAAIGDIIAGDGSSIYIAAIPDTTFSGYTAKKLYRFDVATREIDPAFTITMTGSDNIYGMAYEYVTKRIFIANSRSFLSSGQVLVYETNGTKVKTYELNGFNPVRFAFKY